MCGLKAVLGLLSCVPVYDRRLDLSSSDVLFSPSHPAHPPVNLNPVFITAAVSIAMKMTAMYVTNSNIT